MTINIAEQIDAVQDNFFEVHYIQSQLPKSNILLNEIEIPHVILKILCNYYYRLNEWVNYIHKTGLLNYFCNDKKFVYQNSFYCLHNKQVEFLTMYCKKFNGKLILRSPFNDPSKFIQNYYVIGWLILENNITIFHVIGMLDEQIHEIHAESHKNITTDVITRMMTIKKLLSFMNYTQEGVKIISSGETKC